MPKRAHVCSLNREQFRAQARPIKVVIAGREFEAEVKEFSTGSLGWFVSGKVNLEVGGVRVPVQVGLNLTIVGSKEAS